MWVLPKECDGVFQEAGRVGHDEQEIIWWTPGEDEQCVDEVSADAKQWD